MNALDLKPMLPWSQESECAVLGAMLADCSAAWDKAQPLTQQHFFDSRHRAIFDAVATLHARREPVDSVTVFEHLRSTGRTEEAGGLVYLNELAQAVYSAHRAGAYARVVREHATRRALLQTLDAALETASAPGGTAAEKLDAITTMLAQLQRQQVAKEPVTLLAAAQQRLDHWDALAQGQATTGWPLHLPGLNRMLKGLRPGGLYFVAARPGVGKSAFALELAARSGLKSLILSLEMPTPELVDRAMACLARVSYEGLQTGQLEDDEWTRLTEVTSSDALQKLHLDDQGSLTLADIRAKAKLIPGLQLLVLDYLQLCAGSAGAGANRNSEIEQISRGLKALAKELGCAVIALSQLNRQVEQRTDKRPMLSDLRDSGSIEQDADAVVALWPAREFSDGARLIGLRVAKNRQGRLGEMALHFDGARQSFHESTERLVEAVAPAGKRKGLADYD